MHPEVKLINMYGITETTVHVTFKELTDADIECSVSNIGRPIPTTTTYVLDHRLRLLPPGVPGELCVGGEGVGRGYLERNELTGQRFVPNPFRSQDRLYRSGDIVRWLPDGELVYHGRMDHQVKLRGFRIELGEVETVLCRHETVAEAVVVLREAAGSSQLVGYVVKKPGSNPDPTGLRAFVQEKLPEHMVPSVFLVVDRIPLTASGKIDRAALPLPEDLREQSRSFTLPSTATEKLVATLWCEVLQLERVSVHESFFELGGHSLLGTQVISRIREKLQIEIPLKHLFQHPTIAALSEFIDCDVKGQAVSAPGEAYEEGAV